MATTGYQERLKTYLESPVHLRLLELCSNHRTYKKCVVYSFGSSITVKMSIDEFGQIMLHSQVGDGKPSEPKVYLSDYGHSAQCIALARQVFADIF